MEAERWLGFLELGLENKEAWKTDKLQAELLANRGGDVQFQLGLEVDKGCKIGYIGKGQELKAQMVNKPRAVQTNTSLHVYTRRSPLKVTSQWRAKAGGPGTMVVLNRKLALDAVQSERSKIDIRSGAKTISGAIVIVGTSSIYIL